MPARGTDSGEGDAVLSRRRLRCGDTPETVVIRYGNLSLVGRRWYTGFWASRVSCGTVDWCLP